MIKTLLDLIGVLSQKQRRNFFLLQFLIIITSIIEICGFASVAPFIAIVLDPALIDKNQILSAIYGLIEFESKTNFLVFIGGCVLFALTIGNFISLITLWCLIRFAHFLGQSFSNSLYKYYLHQPYFYHIEHNSSTLISKIVNDTHRVIVQLITPSLHLNAKLVLIFFILIGLMIFDPLLTSACFAIFGGSYLLIFLITQPLLTKAGKTVTVNNKRRVKIITEGLGSIKELKLLGSENFYSDQFSNTAENLAKANSFSQIVGQSPRYLLETVAFGSIVLITLYLIINKLDVVSILPVLSLYALAGYKLLPALQNCFSLVVKIKSAQDAFAHISSDLKNANSQNTKQDNINKDAFNLQSEITLNRISYIYPGSKSYSLKDINLTIPAKTSIGIVGPSGSGKTTIVDILLGLLAPTEGHIEMDGTPLSKQNLRPYMNTLGYVPQFIYLADTSIASNIAFGVDEKHIDSEKLECAIKAANLSEVISKLPNGIRSNIGEGGIQLSGGQRQKIGIARAIYHDASIIVLDEATSALDTVAEKSIIETLNKLSLEKTIITIAHRLSTIKNCEVIYLIESGQVADSGTFQELYARAESFKNLVDQS